MANGKSSCKKLGNGNKGKRAAGNALSGLSQLTPQQWAILAGILTNSLSVDSILVDKNQNIQVVLGGSLRRKTRLDKLLEEASDYSLGDILDAIGRR